MDLLFRYLLLYILIAFSYGNDDYNGKSVLITFTDTHYGEHFQIMSLIEIKKNKIVLDFCETDKLNNDYFKKQIEPNFLKRDRKYYYIDSYDSDSLTENNSEEDIYSFIFPLQNKQKKGFSIKFSFLLNDVGMDYLFSFYQDLKDLNEKENYLISNLNDFHNNCLKLDLFKSEIKEYLKTEL